MIISKTPFRLSLGGGGTDLPEYYTRHGSFFISAAINRYVYLTVNPRTIDKTIWLSYSQNEQVSRIEDIEHNLIRESLRKTGIENGIEIHSITELSGGTGMGSSGAFCVGLLNALHGYLDQSAEPVSLAEEAFDIEANILGAKVGKQDQYIAALGDLRQFEIDTEGQVTSKVVDMPAEARIHLNSSLMLFYTGIQRKASTVLDEQSKKLEDTGSQASDSLHEIKQIGLDSAAVLSAGNVDELGPLMHRHWEAKKKVSSKMTISWIDACYEEALKQGATGGKIVGAGGGGFLLFFVPGYESRVALRKLLADKGLPFVPFEFESNGSQIIMRG